jgi:hypothetical protein
MCTLPKVWIDQPTLSEMKVLTNSGRQTINPKAYPPKNAAIIVKT